MNNELPPSKMEKTAKTERTGAMAEMDVTESKAFKELKAKMGDLGRVGQTHG